MLRVVWLAFSGQKRLCSGCGVRPHPSFPPVFFFKLSPSRGRAEGTDKFELTSEPSDSLAHCSSLLAPTFNLPTYLHLLCVQTLQIHVVIVHLRTVGFFEANRTSKTKTSPKGQTCTSALNERLIRSVGLGREGGTTIVDHSGKRQGNRDHERRYGAVHDLRLITSGRCCLPRGGNKSLATCFACFVCPVARCLRPFHICRPCVVCHTAVLLVLCFATWFTVTWLCVERSAPQTVALNQDRMPPMMNDVTLDPGVTRPLSPTQPMLWRQKHDRTLVEDAWRQAACWVHESRRVCRAGDQGQRLGLRRPNRPTRSLTN